MGRVSHPVTSHRYCRTRIPEQLPPEPPPCETTGSASALFFPHLRENHPGLYTPRRCLHKVPHSSRIKRILSEGAKSRPSSLRTPYQRCWRHHSLRTYSDHGRDQEVWPARKAVQTSRTPWECRCGASVGARSAKLVSSRPRSGPRNHSSHGSVKVRFGCARICCGNISPNASTSNAFCVPGRWRAASGKEPTNSTSGVSSSGTRTSSEQAMLTESVSRRSVLAR